MAERALRGVGDAALGEWPETGANGVMHLRRRLTVEERVLAGRGRLLEVRDIRGTPEEQRRFRRLAREAPHTREFIDP